MQLVDDCIAMRNMSKSDRHENIISFERWRFVRRTARSNGKKFSEKTRHSSRIRWPVAGQYRIRIRTRILTEDTITYLPSMCWASTHEPCHSRAKVEARPKLSPR